MKKDIEYEILDESMKDSEYYFHSGFEDIRGFSPGTTSDEIRKIEKSINKCTCGGDIEIHEYELMGDGSYEIVCKKCGRTLERSQYDYDIKCWDDVLAFCIRDWNNGLTTKDIKERNEKENERKRLSQENLIWKEYHPNNLFDNPLEGYYSLLFYKNGDKLYCTKYTIEFQFKEVSPMYITGEIESYNLFMKRYFEIKGDLKYPELSLNTNTSCDTFNDLDVNDFGDFVRNYKTLDEAKLGALSRCGWQGINKDTLLKL